MSEAHYFPMMMDIRGKAFLLVGGGNIACEKLGRIREWSRNVTIVARDVSEPMRSMADECGADICERTFEMNDLEGVDIVIVAVDDLQLQRAVYEEATRRKILCNAVDLAECCHFIFPSVIRKGDLVVAVSTSGASPALAKYLRRFFENLIPQDIGTFLERMRAKRTALPKGKERMKLLDGDAQAYMSRMREYGKQRLNESEKNQQVR